VLNKHQKLEEKKMEKIGLVKGEILESVYEDMESDFVQLLVQVHFDKGYPPKKNDIKKAFDCFLEDYDNSSARA
jgi:hypothetical protein